VGGKDFKYCKDGRRPGKYPLEIREQAASMFERTRAEFRTRADYARHVAELPGIGTHETVPAWIRQSEIDGGERAGITTEENEELRHIRREDAELGRANGILKAASAFFAAEFDWPQNRQQPSWTCLKSTGKEGLLWRVGPICAVVSKEYGVKISPFGYYVFKKRKPSLRTSNDQKLKERILALWEENHSCWGVVKAWRELLAQGVVTARCTVERLIRELRIKGRSRARIKRTTIAGAHAKSAEDLVRRNFYATRPDRIWVADFTCVST
jgi:transposase-like protein